MRVNDRVSAENSPQATTPLPDDKADDTPELDAYSSTIVSVVDKVGPSVVSIRTRQGSRHGAGSGVIITPDGYVLTNHHVIHGSSAVDVITANGKIGTATLVGVDAGTDLALLRIDIRNLPTRGSDTVNAYASANSR